MSKQKDPFANVSIEEMLAYLQTGKPSPELLKVLVATTGIDEEGNVVDEDDECPCGVCKAARGEHLSPEDQADYDQAMREGSFRKLEESFARLYIGIRGLNEGHQATQAEYDQFRADAFGDIIRPGTHLSEISKDQIRRLLAAELKWALQQLGEA